MVASWGAIRLGLRPALLVLFVFKESYVVLLIEQIWSYIDSTLESKAAKRLNGPICGVAGIGAVAGGAFWASCRSAGTLNMLLLAAAATLLTLPLLQLLFAKFGAPTEGKKKQSEKGHLALHLFRTEPVLLLLISLIASTQVLSTILELAFRRAARPFCQWPMSKMRTRGTTTRLSTLPRCFSSSSVRRCCYRCFRGV